ncbi:MAG: glycosyltransferase family 39 protein [Elusimicrobia bacterium]|nr:glycosyltransferase family 39 protein [Elusimicrobiota bacterium]
MTRRLCLALVAAASIAAHLKGIASPPLDYHYHRQCNTATIARNYHRNGLRFGTPQIDWEGDYAGKAATEFPLYMWLMGLFWPIAGLGALWGRLLSSAFSALTAVYLFLFLDKREKRLERRAALYAGVLFSAIPLEVYFGRTIQPEALALLATMGALYHWDAWLDAPRKRGHWAAATGFAFLAIAHKLPYLYLLLPLAGLAWLPPRRRPWSDPWAWSACALTLAGVAGWYRYASSGVFVVPAHAGEFLKMLEYEHLPYFIFFQFFSRLPELAATYGGLALGVAGAWRLAAIGGQRFFALWWAAVAIDMALAGGYAHWHEYTSLPFAPVNAALIGAGLDWLQKKSEMLAPAQRFKARLALAGLALSIPLHAALRIGHWYRVDYPYLWGADKAAASVSLPQDLFVCNQRTSSACLFSLDRKGWSWEVTEVGARASAELLERRVNEGAKFYATSKSRLDEPEAKTWKAYLEARHKAVYDRDDLLIFRLTGS